MLGGLKRSARLNITGNANKPLAANIHYLGSRWGMFRRAFRRRRTDVRILENVRGCDCYVIQPTCRPGQRERHGAADNAGPLRRAAGRITAVIPYYGTPRRQENLPGSPSRPSWCNLITRPRNRYHAGPAREQIQGFSTSRWTICTPIPFPRLPQVKDLPTRSWWRPTWRGGKGEAIAKRLTGLVIIDNGAHDNHAVVYNVVERQELQRHNFRRYVDTAGPCARAEAVKDQGRRRFSRSAPTAFCQKVPRLHRASPLEELIITNTVPFPASGKADQDTVSW